VCVPNDSRDTRRLPVVLKWAPLIQCVISIGYAKPVRLLFLNMYKKQSIRRIVPTNTEPHTQGKADFSPPPQKTLSIYIFTGSLIDETLQVRDVKRSSTTCIEGSQHPLCFFLATVFPNPSKSNTIHHPPCDYHFNSQLLLLLLCHTHTNHPTTLPTLALILCICRIHTYCHVWSIIII
jgi:hypothetical protein